MGATITYKGSVIAELNGGETKKLKTSGKYLEGDLTVEAVGGGGGGECDLPHIIEVDVLPTENIDKESIYELKTSFEDLIISAWGDAISYRELTEEAGIPFSTNIIPTRTTENIQETQVGGENPSMHLYYIKDEDDIFIYVDIEGSGNPVWASLSLLMEAPFRGIITDISQATTDGYYLLGSGGGYYKYFDASFDDVVYNGVPMGAMTAGMYYESTKPTENIQASDLNNDLIYLYYIADENDVFLYSEGQWLTVSMMLSGSSFGGVITDAIDATDNSCYYAVITPADFQQLIAEQDVVHPAPVLQSKKVNKNGTVTCDIGYDGLEEVNIDVQPLYEVSASWDMSSIRNYGATDDLIGAVYKYVGTTDNTYENGAFYMLQANVKGYYFVKVSVPDISEGSLVYELSSAGDYYTVISVGDSIETELVIPSTYNGLPVKYIGGEAFQDCARLFSVTIPDTVTRVRYDAFSRCKNLKKVVLLGIPSDGFDSRSFCSEIDEVHLPNDLKTWCETGSCNSNDGGPFGAGGLGYLYINDELITDLMIPDGTNRIKSGAFDTCGSIKSVYIPGSVTSIAGHAFCNCKNLTDITIGDGVTYIGSSAFADCGNTGPIEIPASVTRIDEAAFDRSPYWYDDNSWENGALYMGDCLVDVNKGVDKRVSELVIKEGTRLLADSLFSWGDNGTVTKVVIPDSVMFIGAGAFYGCTSLASIIYNGTIAQWNTVTKGDRWNYNCPATEVVCSNGSIILEA